MNPLTPEAIAEIRARVEAATYGPWTAHDVQDEWVVGQADPGGISCLADCGDGEDGQADAEFIAATRSDVPRLLDAYEELQEENERLYDLLFWISEYPNRCAGDPEDQALNLAVVARKGLSAEDSA